MLVSLSLATAGHFALKVAMNRVGRIGTDEITHLADTVARAASEPRLWLGLFLFGLSAVFWLVVLSRVPLSVAYPAAGLSYVLVVALDRFVLDVEFPSLRWVGAAVIAVGIALIGISARPRPTRLARNDSVGRSTDARAPGESLLERKRRLSDVRH